WSVSRGYPRHTNSESLLPAVSLSLSYRAFRGRRASGRRFIALTAALPLLELMHNLGSDLGRPAAHVDDDRMLIRCWFLQCRKLAIEQGHRHEVLVARGHAPADEVVRSFEVDQRHVAPAADDDVPVGPLQGRAGQHAGFALRAPAVDFLGDLVKPRH